MHLWVFVRLLLMEQIEIEDEVAAEIGTVKDAVDFIAKST